MKACWYEATGAAANVLKIGDIALAEPGPGDVVVDVHRSGVNTTDLKRRAGARGGMPFAQVVPHFDAAGVISAVGKDVDAGRVGTRVWVWEGQYRKAFGTCAEQVIVPTSRARPLPESMSFAHGATLGVPALTAAHALAKGGGLDGKTVLVSGGAGAVGNFAIQLAKKSGATVISTVSGDQKAQDAKAAGADHVINYKTEVVAVQVLNITGGEGVHHMVDLDLGAHLLDAHNYVARRGSIAAYGSGSDTSPKFEFPKFMYRNISIHGVAIFDVSEADKLAAVSLVENALADGLICRTDKTFALEECATAHERLESGDAIGSVQIGVRD